MDVSTQIDATNLSSQPTAPAMGQAIPQNHFSLMVGQLRAHSLHPDYLPHSTTIPIPHSTSPTPPPIYRGGAQGDSAQGLHAAGRPDLTTWSDDNTCRWAQSLSTCFVVSWTLCISTDCWLWGVSVHISTSPPPRFSHSPPSGLRL